MIEVKARKSEITAARYNLGRRLQDLDFDQIFHSTEE